MSILITGMEMPNKKNGAALIIYPDGKCAFEDGKTYQAVPVPPHGRCIDADALAKDDWYLNRYVSDSNGCWIENMTLEDAPTIIPADEPFGKSEQLNL